MSEIRVIGVCGESLDDQHKSLLPECRAVAAAGRHAHLLEGYTGKRLPITPLDLLFTHLGRELEHGPVAVLASGDPLFFGIGRRLLTHFGRERLRFFPALSSLQLACSRFGVPWDDLEWFSLHGRSGDDIAGRILSRSRVLLLTDPTLSPAAIARLLRQRLEDMGDSARLARVRLQVAENLGLADEEVRAGGLAEIAAASFSPLTVVLVEQEQRAIPGFGLRENEIVHNRGLITKDEVRAAILHQLRLPATGVMWDIGGGSGSISLEAGGIAPELSIFCIEKTEEGQEAIRRNIVTSGRYRINLIRGEAPAALAPLPDPDRIFIGGSGGRLAGIIDFAATRLRPRGILVASAVLAKSAELAPRCLAAAGLRVEQRRIRVERLADDGITWRRHNPITLITGQK